MYEKLFQVGVPTLAIIGQYLFGEWPPPPTLLLLFVTSCMDYATGMAAAAYEGQLKSKVGFKGIGRKIAIYAVIVVAHFLDVYLIHFGMESKAMIMNAAILFYFLNELLSITENVGRMGVPIPEPVRNAIVVLRGKDEKKTV